MAAPASIPMANGAVLQLPPGFKFSPSDEELVVQYLRRRAVDEPLPCAFVVDVDIQQHTPWDLVPGHVSAESAKRKYFFARKELKYRSGRRANRAAGEGYWRATGSETPVYAVPGGSAGPVLVGMKRTLVFYRGQPLARERTGWVMHEYRLAGAGLMPCRVMRRANSNRFSSPHAAASIAKKNSALAATCHAMPACVPLVPVLVHPDESWVICGIYNKKQRTNANGGGGAGVPFIDFLGRPNGELSPTPSCSCITDTSVEKEEGGDDKAGSSEGS